MHLSGCPPTCKVSCKTSQIIGPVVTVLSRNTQSNYYKLNLVVTNYGTASAIWVTDMNYNFVLQFVPTTPLCSGLSIWCVEVTVEVDMRIMELCVLQQPNKNTRQVWGGERCNRITELVDTIQVDLLKNPQGENKAKREASVTLQLHSEWACQVPLQ